MPSLGYFVGLRGPDPLTDNAGPAACESVGREVLLVMDTPTVTSTLGTALGTVATDAQSAIMTVLPIALPILGAIIVVVVGIKVFKKITGR